PLKVVKSALQGAVSIAGMLLNTEAMVTDLKEEEDGKKGGGMGGMPGMGGMGGMMGGMGDMD
ncbi:MAG TPA: hypothetical protein VMC61_07890, partial [Methanocella sp.]|nr:hypothetical protein [Methanocella sp.]